MVNQHLLMDLTRLGMWSADLKNELVAAEGSVQVKGQAESFDFGDYIVILADQQSNCPAPSLMLLITIANLHSQKLDSRVRLHCCLVSAAHQPLPSKSLAPVGR